MTRAGPESVTEVWTYGGVRVGKGGKRVHAWLDTRLGPAPPAQLTGEWCDDRTGSS